MGRPGSYPSLRSDRQQKLPVRVANRGDVVDLPALPDQLGVAITEVAGGPREGLLVSHQRRVGLLVMSGPMVPGSPLRPVQARGL